jgi:RNA recognition motif-containing protein
VNDQDLTTLFCPFGTVLSAKVYMDKTTEESKGFGFISFEEVKNANSAITCMNGFQLGSKRLKVVQVPSLIILIHEQLFKTSYARFSTKK